LVSLTSCAAPHARIGVGWLFVPAFSGMEGALHGHLTGIRTSRNNTSKKPLKIHREGWFASNIFSGN